MLLFTFTFISFSSLTLDSGLFHAKDFFGLIVHNRCYLTVTELMMIAYVFVKEWAHGCKKVIMIGDYNIIGTREYILIFYVNRKFTSHTNC